MTTDRDLENVAALEEVGKTTLGHTIFREPNEVGGYRYWSDEIGGGVCAWDTCLVSPETLQECLRVELAHAREAVAQEPVAVPAKKLYPAHPRALRASIAELDMWLDSSDTLDEIENQQSFGESIMLVVHELKRLQAVIAAAPVSPPTDHSEDTLDMVKAPPADSGEVERLREAVETANKAIAEYIRYLDGGEMRGSYDGKPERDGLRKAEYATRFALKQTLGGSHA